MTRFATFAGALAFLFLRLAAIPAATPSSELPPDFFQQLAAAKSPAEQDKILRDAKLPLSGKPLWRQISLHAYHLGIDGNYADAQIFNEIVLRLGGDEEKAAAHIQNAYLFREEGDIDGALRELATAFGSFVGHDLDKHILVSASQLRGICYLSLSDFAHALQWLHRALRLSEEMKYPDGIVPALNSIGEVYRSQGEPARALTFYERARKIVGNDEAWNMAFIFNNIGMCYDAMGDIDRAIENINRARAVAEKVHARPRVETSLAVLGDLELKRGHLDTAGDFYGQSLKLARELGRAEGEARATLGAARVALARGETRAALAGAQESAALSRKTGHIAEVTPALTLCGQCLQTLGREEEAKSAFKGAIAAVEEMRGQVAGGDLEREALFAQQIAPYRALVALLVRQKQPEKALLAAEASSARVLLDATNGERTEWSSLLTPEERARNHELDLQSTQATQDITRLRSAAKVDPAALARAEAKQREAQAAQEDFAALVQSSHPELQRMKPPAALHSLAELKPNLRGDNKVLLRFLFIVTLPNESGAPALKVISLGKNRAALARLTNDYRTRVAGRSLAWEQPARELYDLLLRPAQTQLEGADAIVIVPDGPLWELPFQSLERDANHPVLIDYSVRYAPSLTLLARSEKRPPAALAHQLLAFVNPALDDAAGESRDALSDRAWQPLPEMEKQVSELAKIYPEPAGEILVGAAAREKTFKADAASAEILHFATHGVLDDRAPLYSYLLLSQAGLGLEEDGRLEARELMQLRLHARLAVLCGCETARGEVTAGEGVIGLSWGFMVAGCPATVVSQWKVESASSSALMVKLHQQLHDGAKNAEALREASLEVRKNPRYRHPFYWAPFVLIGTN
jgi:CHAT domain-containing protein